MIDNSTTDMSGMGNPLCEAPPDITAYQDAITNGFNAPAAHPTLHLYAVILFATRNDSPTYDAMVVSSISDSEAGAVAGAKEANLKVHPLTDWINHAESPTQIPDDLVLRMADIIKKTVGTPGPVGSGIPAFYDAPTVPLMDITALQSAPLNSRLAPDTHEIDLSVKSERVVPLNMPDNPTVAFDANSIGFRIPQVPEPYRIAR